MKLCMIGVRGHYGYALNALKDLPQVRIAGVCAGTDEDDVSPLKHWCDEHGHEAGVFGDYIEMLDSSKPDMVVVSGPFERHAEMSMESFRRGIHVFCEKPVALVPAELESLRAAHAGSGVHFAGMMGLRYDPAFYTAWRAVREGRVGDIRLISTRKSYKLGQRSPHFHARATSGGTIPWVGSHAIDWIHWFAAQPFLTVAAAHSTLHNQHNGELEMSAMCQFTLGNEIIADASIDYLRPAPAPTHGDDRLRVAGTLGVIEVSRGEVSLITAGGTGETALPPTSDRQVFTDFVAHIEGKTQALLNAEDTFTVTEACLLARQAADERRVLAFPGR